jgi:hypothetical protein
MSLNETQKVLFILSILFLVVLLMSSFIQKELNIENYGWSCTYTPNKDYYLEDWILGSNPAGLAMARDSIKHY